MDTVVKTKRSGSAMKKGSPTKQKTTTMWNSNMPAPIKKDLRQRFYTAVVFLKAVTRAYAINRQPTSHDPIWQSDNHFEITYQNFLNRLSQFCDVKLGGDSVTAFTVLDMQDRVQYRFACNRMNKSRLERISGFVSDLLDTLNSNPTPREQLEQILLRKVLAHCRTRVHSYLTTLTKACRACIETKPADRRTLDHLGALCTAASEADFKRFDEDTFAQRCRRLLDLLRTYTKGPDATILAERVTHSNMTQSSSCWSELRHYAGRLLSYHLGVEALLAAAKTFPVLFENHEVVFVRSSQPDENPIDNKEIKAERILRTMTNSADKARYYNSLAQDARSLDLDDAIHEMVSDENFRPIVHAELLVLQSLEREGRVHPSDFFNSWKYIGSSKPTCRLCHYYFQRQNGGFHVRPTHGNLYINWKPPDVFQRDGEARARARQDMLNSIVTPIRDEALRTLTEKVPGGKQHDSTTGMTSRAFGVLDRGAGLADSDIEVDVGAETSSED